MSHNLSDKSEAELVERIELLDVWPRTIAESFESPLCGCEADVDGSFCAWDVLDTLEDELASRSNAAAEALLRQGELVGA